MLDVGRPQVNGALHLGSRYLSAAQAKWERLTASDYAGITNVGGLIAAVVERYGLPHDQARVDVELWLKDVAYNLRYSG
ncbi:MAG: hypothetical protein ACRED5_05070 [Propylenella sp.]